MTRLDHVNITVDNIDKSVEWYGALFGFEKVEYGLTQFGKKWAIIACNDSMIAMSEYERRPANQNEEFNFHRTNHFGLRIDDAVEWRQKIKDLKLKVQYGGEIEYPHSRSWYMLDPSGHEIEVSWSNGEPLKFPK
jgi:catechol 2,3-dioxygenase-like lactoylglutathione lyase family enzyme